MKHARHVRPLGIITLAAGLSACATDRTPPADLDEPMIGSSRATTYLVSPADGRVHAGDLAKVARILRRYKTLAGAERALVRSAALHRIGGLIETEENFLRRTRYAAERAALERNPAPAVAKQRLAALDQKIQGEAVANVLRRLGKLVAVPLKTSDNASAVAYARISAGSGGGGVDVTAEAGAYAIDHPIASLIDGAPVQGSAERVATYLQAKPVAVAAGP